MLGQGIHSPIVTKKNPSNTKSTFYINTNMKLSILPTMLQQNDNENNKEKFLAGQYVAVSKTS